jgi:hypothetical protein
LAGTTFAPAAAARNIKNATAQTNPTQTKTKKHKGELFSSPFFMHFIIRRFNASYARMPMRDEQKHTFGYAL